MSESKEQSVRMQACQFITSIGEQMHFPVRTSGMAMVLYHRFHLFYPISDFIYNDVAVACLLVASKLQDTLKKLREILLAAYQVRHPNGPQISIESHTLEEQRKKLIGLERMVLETSCFDFRFQHPQPLIIKLAGHLNLPKALAGVAWDISVDSYKTFIPLQVPTYLWALGCLDLASRVLGFDCVPPFPQSLASLDQIGEVTSELLNLYMYSKNQTILGPSYEAEKFMEVKIDLNKSKAPESKKRSFENMNGDVSVHQLEGPRNGRIGDKGSVRYMWPETRESKVSRR